MCACGVCVCGGTCAFVCLVCLVASSNALLAILSLSPNCTQRTHWNATHETTHHTPNNTKTLDACGKCEVSVAKEHTQRECASIQVLEYLEELKQKMSTNRFRESSFVNKQRKANTTSNETDVLACIHIAAFTAKQMNLCLLCHAQDERGTKKTVD